MITIKKLNRMKESPILEKADIDIIDQIISRMVEDSSTGGPSVSGSVPASGGMGEVISSQPSTNPGALNGSGWIDGGSVGSGDVSIPFNTGGKKAFHKVRFGRNHGPSTGKKSRVKPADISRFKMPKKKIGKIVSFKDFDVTKVTKVEEGVIKRGSALPHENKDRISNRKEDFRIKIKNLIKGRNKSIQIEEIGNDFLLSIDNKDLAQIMFRDSYLSISKIGDKFPKEFLYSEFGKLKKEVLKLINESFN